MFIGLVGSVYTVGYSGAWIMVGWVLGDWVTWFFVHRRLRESSELVQANTIPAFLAHGMKGGHWVAAVAGLLILVFLSIYASAQLNAGGKALEAFGIDATIGVLAGAAIVLIYCVSGGIRASIWTDAVQCVVMFISMTLLLIVVIASLGGIGATIDVLGKIDGYTDWKPDTKVGFPLFMLSWMFAGLGVVGQPHIMIRAMAIDSPDSVAKARRIYMVWNVLFAIICVTAGLVARAYFTTPLEDPQMAFPLLSKAVFPGVLVGMMLAGLFAAIISTADSQVLSCSAALTQDLLPRFRSKEPANPYLTAKLGTVFVTACVLVAALFGRDVFAKVVFAWSAMAASLGPLMIVRVLGWKISATTAIAMMLSGLATVILWIFVLEWNGSVYEAMPGMFVSMGCYGIYRITSR